MAGTPYDTALELRAAANIGTTATTTAIDVEGGSDAELHVAWLAQSGTDPTLQVDLEASVDGGSNYAKIARSRVFTGADDPGTGETYFHASAPVYIPKPTGVDAYKGSALRTKVRVVSTVGGSDTPLFTSYRAWLGAPVSGDTTERANWLA